MADPTPVADDGGDYIRIGAACDDIFSLSITISSISGSSNVFGNMVGPCWLSYKLFGLLVQTDQFDLGAPGFLPIRDIFRMQSTLGDLAAFFASVGTLDVYLCCPGTVLGVANVPVDSLLGPAGGRMLDPHFTEAEVPGGFPLRPLNPPGVVQAYEQGRLVGVDALVNGVVQLSRVAGSRATRGAASGLGFGAPPVRPTVFPGAPSALDSSASTTRDAELLAALRRLQDTGVVVGAGARASTPGEPGNDSGAGDGAPGLGGAPTPPAPPPADVQLLERLLSEAHAAASAKDEELVRLTRQLAAGEATARSEGAALAARVASLEADLRDAQTQLRVRDREAEDAERRVRDLEATVARSTQSQSVREADLGSQVEDLKARLSSTTEALRGREGEVDSLSRRLRELDLAWQERCAAEIKRADAARKQELEAGWAERERQRVAELVGAQENYQRLEMRLRKALAEAERRDSSLKLLTAEAERTLAQRVAELEVAKRHVKEEADHTVRLERARARALGEEIAALQGEVDARRKRERALEEELLKVRDRQLKGPDGELQRRLAVMEAEKASVLRDVDKLRQDVRDSEAAREASKVQMVRLAKELARLRQEERERSQKELAKLQVEYLAKEGRYVLDGERDTLRDIRHQLDAIMHQAPS